MDFFQRQDQSRRRTRWLICYFALAVVSMIAMIYAVAWFATHLANGGGQLDAMGQPIQPALRFWDGGLFVKVALGTLAVITCGTLFKTLSLARGGAAVAESLGGRLVAAGTTDPDERRLLNVVEEMAIASGVAMPQVYLLEDETGINAFAAGHAPADAIVAVTQGCLTRLSRDELQGVIGHEFSHILNGDMRLNVRLIGILFGIFCLATIGRILMSLRSNNSRDRNALPLAGLVLLVIGSLGVLFGRLIQAAVSRQREFLADASSVQFTRNPAGLAGALKKIGGSAAGSRLASNHAPDAGHLFFGNGMAAPVFSFLATHPPLEARIRALEANWDGAFVPVEASRDPETAPPARPPSPPILDARAILMGGLLAGETTPPAPPVIASRAVMPTLGRPTPLHLAYAQKLRLDLPDAIRQAAREPLAAAALICALLLDAEEPARARQLELIRQRFSEPAADRAAALYPAVAASAVGARLPIVSVALGALKQLTPDQFNRFAATLRLLGHHNGSLAVFEFVLQRIVTRQLAVRFDGAPPLTVQFYSLKPLLPDCAVVLSALARAGSDDPAAIQNAFDTGLARFPGAAQAPAPPRLLPPEQCGVAALGAALDRLGQAAPLIKKHLLQASAHVAGADGVLQEAEAELLRAVAASLDCPIPPLQAAEPPGSADDRA